MGKAFIGFADEGDKPDTCPSKGSINQGKRIGGEMIMPIDWEKFALNLCRKRVARIGPDRVVINQEGESKSAHVAAADLHITSDIVFIRNDGWMLGAPLRFEKIAYDMWPENWIAFYIVGLTVAQSIDQYLKATEVRPLENLPPDWQRSHPYQPY